MALDYSKTIGITSLTFANYPRYDLPMANGQFINLLKIPRIILDTTEQFEDNNPAQYDINNDLLNNAACGYRFIVDAYISPYMINKALSGDKLPTSGWEPIIANTVAAALDNNGFVSAPAGKYNKPKYSKIYLGSGDVPFIFDVPSDVEFGKSLLESYKISEEGVPVSYINTTEYAYPIIGDGKFDAGSFDCSALNNATPSASTVGVNFNFYSNQMYVGVGLSENLPIPGSDYQGRHEKWYMPKLFFPYVSWNTHIVVVVWVGLCEIESAESKKLWDRTEGSRREPGGMWYQWQMATGLRAGANAGIIVHWDEEDGISFTNANNESISGSIFTTEGNPRKTYKFTDGTILSGGFSTNDYFHNMGLPEVYGSKWITSD